MYERFLEIAYEADVKAEENEEMLELSREMCNEHVETRAEAIAELREMIFQRNQCKPIRTDDEFLLKFLRARNFIVPRAHALMVRYCHYREQNIHLYDGVDMWGLGKVKAVYAGTFADHPETGRLTIMRFGLWDPCEIPVVDLVRAGTLFMEIGMRIPKLQIIGGFVIVDMEGVTLRHISSFTPTIAYQLAALAGVAFPSRVRTCHFIYYNGLLNVLLYIFKKFIPKDYWKYMFFHGNDLNSLHKHISKDILPEMYGGTCRHYIPIDLWLSKLKKYRDEKFDRDMKQLGYLVKE